MRRSGEGLGDPPFLCPTTATTGLNQVASADIQQVQIQPFGILMAASIDNGLNMVSPPLEDQSIGIGRRVGTWMKR